MRILIPVFSPATGTWGGLTRVIAIIEAARKAGHEAACCASGYLADSLTKRGYHVYVTPHTTLFGLPQPLSDRMEKQSQRRVIPVKPGRDIGSMWLVFALSGYARAGYMKQLVKAQLAAVEDFRPDIIFTDHDPAAAVTGRIADLPVATAYASIIQRTGHDFGWRLMNRVYGGVLRSFDLDPVEPEELLYGPHILKILPLIPELDYNAQPDRPDFCYTGEMHAPIGLLSEETFFPEEGKRYVFAYLGSGSASLDVVEKVLPEVFPEGGDTLCLVGAQTIKERYKIGGVEFKPYVPAASLFPHCDWTICHGGQNTVIQSLTYGVPLIVFPGPVFERRHNARRVAMHGAGVWAELPDFTAEWIRAQFPKQPKLAAGAAKLGKRVESYGGAAAALKAMEAWCESVNAGPPPKSPLYW